MVQNMVCMYTVKKHGVHVHGAKHGVHVHGAKHGVHVHGEKTWSACAR